MVNMNTTSEYKCESWSPPPCLHSQDDHKQENKKFTANACRKCASMLVNVFLFSLVLKSHVAHVGRFQVGVSTDEMYLM